MMAKRVLDIGNCSPDHGAIRAMLERTFGAEVVQADGPDDALPLLHNEPFDLVLVNRKLDRDYSDGLDIIKSIKADAALAALPCMLITNYPDQQEVAVAAGAEYGFGKKELQNEQTRGRLAKFLGDNIQEPKSQKAK
jgi:response regulator RpfG family c-di-GMP phosphodiesterase